MTDNLKLAPISHFCGPPQYGLSIPAVPDGDVPIVGMKDLIGGRVDVSNVAKVKINGDAYQTYSLNAGDLLLNRTNSRELVGKLAIWDYDKSVEAVFASYLVRYPIRAEIADPRYVINALHLARTRYQIERLITPGVSQANINATAFYDEVAIPLPPLGEQRRIADILDAWDRAIAQTEALIDAKRRAYRHAVLTFSEYFRESMVEFGELARLVTERTKPAHPVKSIELEDIESETGRLLKKSMIGASAGQRFQFQPGDTLFAKLRPYLRKYVLASEPGLCSTETWVLRPKETVCVPEMVFYAVQTPQFRAAAEIQAGSKMPRADWSLVEAMPVPVPPDKTQQQRWARYLASVRAEIPLLELKHESLLNQKRGLMQKLLSGDMRLSSIEAAE